MKKFFSVAENRSDGKLFNFRPALFAAGVFCARNPVRVREKVRGCFVPVASCGSSDLRSLRRVCRGQAQGAFRFGRSRPLFLFRRAVFYAGGAKVQRLLAFMRAGHTVVGTIAEKKEYGPLFRTVSHRSVYRRNAGAGAARRAVGASLGGEAALSDEVVLRGTVTTDTDEFGPYGFRAGDIADNVRFKAEARIFSGDGKRRKSFPRGTFPYKKRPVRGHGRRYGGGRVRAFDRRRIGDRKRPARKRPKGRNRAYFRRFRPACGRALLFLPAAFQ